MFPFPSTPFCAAVLFSSTTQVWRCQQWASDRLWPALVNPAGNRAACTCCLESRYRRQVGPLLQTSLLSSLLCLLSSSPCSSFLPLLKARESQYLEIITYDLAPNSPLPYCTDSSRDSINFLHSNLCCTGNSVDNGIVLVTVLVTVKQSLHGVKVLPAFHNTPPVRKLGVHKKLRGDTAETANPNWPKGCPAS